MKEINSSAPVRCRMGVSIDASAEKIWVVMTDIGRWPAWQKKITRAQLKGPVQNNSSFEWRTGGVTIHSRLHTVQPYQHFGWTGRSFGLFAIHNWTLTEKEGTIYVCAEESMEGVIARIFKRQLNSKLGKDMHAWLLYLKQECETS